MSHKTQQTLTFWFYFSRKRFLCVIKWVQAVATFISSIVSGIGWTSVSYDWSMAFKATINQSLVTLAHPNDPTNHCAESLYLFPLFLEFEITIVPCGFDCYRVAKQRNKTRPEIILVFMVLSVLQRS